MAEIRVPVSAPGAIAAEAELLRVAAAERAVMDATMKQSITQEFAVRARAASVKAWRDVNAQLLVNAGLTKGANVELMQEINRQREAERILRLRADAQRVLNAETGRSRTMGGGGIGGGGGAGEGARRPSAAFRGLSRAASMSGLSGLGGMIGIGASLGPVGMGVAGGAAAVTAAGAAISAADDMKITQAHALIDAEHEMADAMRAASKAARDFGAEAIAKHGNAIVQLTALGGKSAVADARKLQKDTGDTTATEAMADAYKRFPGSMQQMHVINAAKGASELGFGSLADNVAKINPQMLGRAMHNDNGEGEDHLTRFLIGGESRLDGAPISKESLAMMRHQVGTPEVDAIQAAGSVVSDIDAAKTLNISKAEGGKREELASVRAPLTASFSKKMQEMQPEEDKLRFDLEHEHISIFGKMLGTMGVRDTPSTRMEKFNERKSAMADQAAPGMLAEAAAHLKAAAAALESRGSGSAPTSAP